uniref:(northern house mosquito) hypothetical protein n=1 Tax=Culex pipiens TaxID=7175 RepID=A0A8D8K7D0_CULPI
MKSRTLASSTTIRTTVTCALRTPPRWSTRTGPSSWLTRLRSLRAARGLFTATAAPNRLWDILRCTSIWTNLVPMLAVTAASGSRRRMTITTKRREFSFGMKLC